MYTLISTYFRYTYLPFLTTSFLCIDLSFHSLFFYQPLDHFKISYSTDILTENSLILLIWKRYFVFKNNLNLAFFFPFSTLNMSSHCFLACLLSDEKSAMIFFFFFFCSHIKWYFFPPLTVFKIFFLSLELRDLTTLHFGVVIFVILFKIDVDS